MVLLQEYKFVTEKARKDESTVFLTTAVPLKLKAVLKTGQKILVWKNPKPGGTRLCRPVKLKFVKETPQVILAEKSRLEQCFASVPDLKVDIGEEEPITIKFRAKDFMYTMVDGRVVNVFSNSSNSSCRLCKAPPSRLNDIDYL